MNDALREAKSRLDWLTQGYVTGWLYQKAMIASGRWQDRAGWGPWKDVRHD
jgi:hypothetical protein